MALALPCVDQADQVAVDAIVVMAMPEALVSIC
jgi:hypothetical protein